MVRREHRVAQSLCEQLRQARHFAPVDEVEYLNLFISQAEQLERYFREMGDLTDRMYTEFGILSHEIRRMLEDNAHWYDRLIRY